MTENSPIDEARMKHLELIQSVISRLGNNGFLIKGWSLTVAAAFFGFAVQSENPLLAAAYVPLAAVFWGLDAYFLRSERLFRELYRRVAEKDPTIPAFFMAATDPQRTDMAHASECRYRAVLWSMTLRSFYIAIMIVGLGVVLLLAMR
jgi:hypothetical protein